MKKHCSLLQNTRPKRARITGPQQRTSFTVLSEELKPLEGLCGLFNRYHKNKTQKIACDHIFPFLLPSPGLQSSTRRLINIMTEFLKTH